MFSPVRHVVYENLSHNDTSVSGVSCKILTLLGQVITPVFPVIIPVFSFEDEHFFTTDFVCTGKN